jgi:sortase family protein
MRARRSHLFVTVCFAALAVASAGCGDPQATSHTVVENSPTEGAAAATAAPDATSPATETSATPAPAEDTPPSPTSEPLATPTSVATPGVEPTATVPPPCRKISFGPSETLTSADLAARGRGAPVRKLFLGVSLVITRIGVNAPFVVRVVGADGAMPPPGSATDVAWYDFSAWPELGGSPGTDHGNVIVAGNYDLSDVPQAVFYRLSELVSGDLIQINTSDGRTLAYAVEFNKVTPVDAIDWSALVASTPEESITLITAAAPLNQGRRIVWGRALDTGCSR